MSQDIFSSIDPAISGDDLAVVLNNFKDALVSGLIGPSRPAETQPGGSWIDNSNDPTSWTFKTWTGVDEVSVFEIDLVNASTSVSLAVDSFIVKKVSADTVGAVMELVKRRIATNGQVLSGDVVGEIRMVGRDDAASNPVVAKIIYTATENQTASAYGGTLSFQSTPAGQAALVEHMRFIGGLVETVVPLKTNAAILVSQNVATTATIAQLSADKVLVEMTGSTATDIEGLNSGHASKVVTIHNRSSATTTLTHEGLLATPADRIKLPEGKNVDLLPQDSVTLYYCSADSRWKLLFASARFTGFTTDTIYGSAGSWLAPDTVSKVRVTAHSRKESLPIHQDNRLADVSEVVDIGNSSWMWGFNSHGQLGVGDVTPRSSPVAVLGGLKFIQVSPPAFTHAVGITATGAAFAWGFNNNGQLGVGDVTDRSSPVAVLGGLQFKKTSSGNFHNLGLAVDGTVYAWGRNVRGQLGVGDTTPRSSPVAVLGGLKFREICAVEDKSFGITFSGDLYAWGDNSFGELGIGDVTARSSPVAVLGGLKFKIIKAALLHTYGITEGGDAYAWGLNAGGELGVGNVIPRSSPVAVLGGLKFQNLFFDPLMGGAPGSDAYVFGLTEDGVAYAWGANFAGDLGVGDNTPRSSPVAVLGGLLFQTLAAFRSTSLGLTQDGELYAWGSNPDGELGVGDVNSRSSPVAVLGGLTFLEVRGAIDSVGASAQALTTDGRLFAWGSNAFGQLGVGDVTPRSSPVAVLGGLSLRTQDDSDTVLDTVVVGGNTYALKLGAGPCFFGNKAIGSDIYKAEITYVE